MFVTRIKNVLAVVLVVAALAGAAGIVYRTNAVEQLQAKQEPPAAKTEKKPPMTKEEKLHLADRLATFPERPVLLWTCPSWHDRLHLWWGLDALQRTRLSLDRFWIAQPAVEEGFAPDNPPAFSLGAYLPRCFRDADVRPLDRETVKAGTSLWRAFAGRSPTAFTLVCRQGRRLFSDLPEVAGPYRSLFPRIVRRRLMLSEFDQALLCGLRTSTWRTLVGMLRGDSRAFDFLGYFGDWYLIRRLREWAETPAVQMRVTGDGNEITAVSFRLTAEGERLREQGMRAASEAPVMWIGGCRLYGNGPVWVRRNQDSYCRFEHVGATTSRSRIPR
jgi:hypothetical protein